MDICWILDIESPWGRAGVRLWGVVFLPKKMPLVARRGSVLDVFLYPMINGKILENIGLPFRP